MYAIFEILVVAVIIAFSVLKLVRTALPKTAGTGRRADTGCGSGGCGSCKGCSSFSFDPAAEPDAPAVKR